MTHPDASRDSLCEIVKVAAATHPFVWHFRRGDRRNAGILRTPRSSHTYLMPCTLRVARSWLFVNSELTGGGSRIYVRGQFQINEVKVA